MPDCWPYPAACSREKASLQMQKECLSPPLKSMLLFLAHFIADVAEVWEGCGDERSKCLTVFWQKLWQSSLVVSEGPVNGIFPKS